MKKLAILLLLVGISGCDGGGTSGGSVELEPIKVSADDIKVPVEPFEMDEIEPVEIEPLNLDL